LEGWINNAVYTGCSRVRYINQLIRVSPPNDILEYIEPTELQATLCPQIIEAKLRRYKLNDRKQNRHFPRPLMENNKEMPVPSITVEDVMVMAIRQNKCCKVCLVPLLFQGYPNRHPQSFSIDRLNDDDGHYRENVRITCLRCNERHRR